MNSRPLSLLLLCVCLTGVVALDTSQLAHAKETQEDPTALLQARRRFKEGVRFFETKQYKKARAAFLQAYALKTHPTVLLNLAQSELRAGFSADAATHFAQFLRESDGAQPGEVKLAQEGLSKAKKKVAEVVVAVDVDDAFILVDGELRGRSPLPDPLYLTPGTHSIGVRKRGTSLTRHVTAVPGESSTEMVNVTSTRAPGPTAPADPDPDSDSDPDPNVDEAAEDAAIAEESEYDGTGREPFFRWLRSNPLGLIGAGVATLGAGTSVVFTVTWANNESAANSTRDNILAAAQEDGLDYGPCANPPTPGYYTACQDYVAFRDSADRDKNLAIVFGAVSVLAIGGTITAYFVTADEGAEAARQQRPGGMQLSLVPSLAPEQQGLQVIGQF